jgi:RimJ/RimL family protein N-acetyltransferase
LQSYLRKISRRSGYDLSDYSAELGWIYTTPAVRGRHLASRIVEEVCASYRSGIFATTRTDNAQMQGILQKLGFEKAGTEYDSEEHPGKKLQAWVLPR